MLPAFRINLVVVRGAQKVDVHSVMNFVNQELDRDFLGWHWRRVAFLTPHRQIAAALDRSASSLIDLQNVKVSRDGLKTLIVTIEERQPSAIWESGGQIFFLDTRGYIIERASSIAIEHFPLLEDTNDLPTALGTRVVQSSVISGLSLLGQKLPTIGITIARFRTWPVQCQQLENINSATNSIMEPDQGFCDRPTLAAFEPTIEALTTDGWTIRFDSSGDLESQLMKLQTALQERIRDRQRITYIDVRFGDRVFYQ